MKSHWTSVILKPGVTCYSECIFLYLCDLIWTDLYLWCLQLDDEMFLLLLRLWNGSSEQQVDDALFAVLIKNRIQLT